MEKEKILNMKILVTGKNGLMGCALQKTQTPGHEFVFIGREEVDLTNEQEVESMFRILKPDWVIHTAAKVGGIGGNINEPADMFHKNILMNTHIIHYAYKYNVQKLLAFSSVCVFPDGIPVLREDLMQQGEPYHTQFAYATAKRAIDSQIKSYKKQYGERQYCSIIPCNIFGPEDYYNLQSGHVIPSLIHKIYLAKKNNTLLTVWGDGSAKREFIYSHDIARIVLEIINLDTIPERIIVSNNNQITIKDMVERLCYEAGYEREIIWDTTKPNGQHARPSDLTLLNSLIQKPNYTNMNMALKDSYNWFEINYPKVRM